MQTQRTDVDMWGERGGGMNWEIKIDIYALPCVKQIAEPDA